jgi:hypothetical protein
MYKGLGNGWILLRDPSTGKRDMRFGTWNIRSLYRAVSMKTVARELGKYKLDLLGVQEVRWEKEGTEGKRIIRFLWTGE